MDPEIMAGDQWVHPTNDIGWNTTENRELLESKNNLKEFHSCIHQKTLAMETTK